MNHTWKRVNMRVPEIRFDYYDDKKDEEYEVVIPAIFEVCPACGGRGASSAYLGAFTREDMDEQGPEFMESYMNGAYDRRCDECDGERVIAVPDRRRGDPEDIKLYDDWVKSDYEDLAMYRAEMRLMGDYC